MHHKRHRPKSRRAGCLLCKPHKHQGAKHTSAVRIRRQIRADASFREQNDDR